MYDPPHPGGIVKRQCLDPNLSLAQSARSLGVTQQELLDLINERIDISPDMAKRLAKTLVYLLEYGLECRKHGIHGRHRIVKVIYR